MAKQAQKAGTVSRLTVKNPNLEKVISTIAQAAETKDSKKILADIGLITKEDKMLDTEKDLNELNVKLAEDNKQLRETAELLFKENQTLRNELNTLNVIILRKAAQEVGIQYGEPPRSQEAATANSKST